MGVDYEGVGGIGIQFTDEMKDVLIKNNIFTEEEWAEDYIGCIDAAMSEIGIDYSEAGSYYSGESRIYLLVDGNTLPEIIVNSKIFIALLSKMGISVTTDDLIVVSDLLVY